MSAGMKEAYKEVRWDIYQDRYEFNEGDNLPHHHSNWISSCHYDRTGVYMYKDNV